MSWRVYRINVLDLVGEQRQQVLDWVTRLGVDVNDVRPQLTVSAGEDDPLAMKLHLSRFYRVDGEKVPDHNLDVIATTPLVVDIDPSDPPPWLRQPTKE